MAAGLAESPVAKKSGGPKGGQGEAAPQEPEVRKNVISIRGTEAWRQWLNGLADHRRLSAVDVIDHALIEYAEKHGYEVKAPRR